VSQEQNWDVPGEQITGLRLAASARPSASARHWKRLLTEAWADQSLSLGKQPGGQSWFCFVLMQSSSGLAQFGEKQGISPLASGSPVPGNILRENHAPLPISRYEIMSACWRADPAARPTFSQLKVHLEKLLESLPAVRGSGDVIYINTSLPEESPDSTQDSGFPQADSDLEPGDGAEPCSPQVEAALVAVDVHHNEPWETRYVLEEQLGVPVEEAYVPLLPEGAAGEGSPWTQASTLPAGGSLLPGLPHADGCAGDSEVLL